MYLDKLDIIYIHPPKTGGTFIENNLINYSYERKTLIEGYSDHQNVFGLDGQYTKNKHQNLSEYKKLMSEKLFLNSKILISVREPLDRIISYYFGAADKRNQKTFSIIKNINTFSQKIFKKYLFGKNFYKYIQPKYTEEDFINFINIVSNQTDFLKINNTIENPDFIINFSKMNNDLEMFLKKNNIPINQNLKKKYNVGKYKFDISLIKENKNIIKAIENSHHFIDYQTFNFKI